MIAAQVLLVTGFLGAGKTTLINRLLRDPGGRRIAAIVNDFGTVDIDGVLLSGATEAGVLSLANGCICCTLQRDLLRTLSNLMKRDPAPDTIVIETSGISNPKEIISNLLDPVIFRFAALDTVATVVDAASLADCDALPDERIWKAQIEAADLLIFSRTDLIDRARFNEACAQVLDAFPGKHYLEASDAAPSLLLGHALHAPVASARQLRVEFPFDFETATWTCTEPIALAGFQALLNDLSTWLLRAKGFVEFAEAPGHPMLFQLVGKRATVTASPVDPPSGSRTSLVLIARRKGESKDEGIAPALAALDRLASS